MKALLDTIKVELDNAMAGVLDAINDMENVHGVTRPDDGKMAHIMAAAALEAYKNSSKFASRPNRRINNDFDVTGF
jgi:hypothetical protein